MTLLSNASIAPSTSRDVAIVPDQPSVNENSPSPSPSTPTTGPSPSQVLAMTIKKKRKVLRSRDRNLRVEILLTSTIRRLCQEIGDHLRSRRMANNKRKAMDQDRQDGEAWTPTVSHCSPKRPREEGKEEQEVGLDHARGRHQSPTCSVGPLAQDQMSETHSIAFDEDDRACPVKRREAEPGDIGPSKRVASSVAEDNFNEKDPFGLDEFFRSLRTCRVGGSKR